MSNLTTIMNFDRMVREFRIESETYIYCIQRHTTPTEITGWAINNDRPVGESVNSTIFVIYDRGQELRVERYGAANTEEIKEMKQELEAWLKES